MKAFALVLFLLSSTAFASGHCRMTRTGERVEIDRFFEIARQQALASHRCVTAGVSASAIGAYQFDALGQLLDPSHRITGCAVLLCDIVP